MKLPLWMALCLLLIELLTVLIILPGDWTYEVIEKEQQLVRSSLGREASDWIDRRAEGIYNSTIVQTGFREALWHTFIPTAEERERSTGLQNLGSVWFQWAGARIEAVLATIYQTYKRLVLLMAWAPFMVLLLVPALYDGYMTRKIKRTDFSYASPVIHRYSAKGILYLGIGVLLALFAPVAVHPLMIPIVLMLICILLGLSVANLQKRI